MTPGATHWVTHCVCSNINILEPNKDCEETYPIQKVGPPTFNQYSSRTTAINWTTMPVVLAAIHAAVAAAAGKAAAEVGITAAGTAAGYRFIRAIQKAEEPTPQISDSVLSS